MASEYYTINQNLNKDIGEQFEVVETNEELRKILYPDLYKTRFKAIARRLAYRWNKQEKLKLWKEAKCLRQKKEKSN